MCFGAQPDSALYQHIFLVSALHETYNTLTMIWYASTNVRKKSFSDRAAIGSADMPHAALAGRGR